MSSLLAFIEKKKSHLWASLTQVQRSFVQFLIFTVIIAIYDQEDALKFGQLLLTVLSGGFFLNLFFYTLSNDIAKNKTNQLLFPTSLHLSILGLLPALFIYFYLFETITLPELILICLFSILNSFNEFFFIAFNHVGKLAKLKKLEFFMRVFTTIICFAFIILQYNVVFIILLLLSPQILSAIILLVDLKPNFSFNPISKISIIKLMLENKTKLSFQVVVAIILLMFSPVAIELLGNTPEVIFFSRLLLFSRNLISIANKVNANISIEKIVNLLEYVLFFTTCIATVTFASFVYIRIILKTQINVFSTEVLCLTALLLLSYLIELLGSRYKINR